MGKIHFFCILRNWQPPFGGSASRTCAVALGRFLQLQSLADPKNAPFPSIAFSSSVFSPSLRTQMCRICLFFPALLGEAQMTRHLPCRTTSHLKGIRRSTICCLLSSSLSTLPCFPRNPPPPVPSSSSSSSVSCLFTESSKFLE